MFFSCVSLNFAINSETLQRLKGLLRNLDKREKTILVMRYGLDGNHPKTLEEVSSVIDRTRERVRQIQMQSLKKLKTLIENENDDNFGNRHEGVKSGETEVTSNGKIDWVVLATSF